MGTQENRKYPRFDIAAKIQFKKVKDNSEPKDAFVKNISAEGVCFCSNENFNPGDILEVNIIEQKTEEPIYIRGQVAWSEKMTGQKDEKNRDMFLTGVKVLGIRDTDEARFAMLYSERMLAELKSFLHL